MTPNAGSPYGIPYPNTRGKEGRPKFLAFAVSCALALCGCANAQQARVQTEAATVRFHEHFNRGQFDAIHAAADPDFQKAGTAQQLRESLEIYRSQLGPFQRAAKPGSWELNWNTNGAFVTLTTESTFANGSAQENFVWRVGGTECVLLRYSLDNMRILARARVPVVQAKAATRPVRFMPFRASLEHLHYLQLYYREQLGLDIELLPELKVDRAAWTSDRQQWSAEGLAEQVRQSIESDDAVVIGITGEDIYLRRSNWRFAFGFRADHVAIVSYARMDPQFFRQPGNLELTQRRLRHMVTKNLGLMLFNMDASPDPASPLYKDIGGIEELDAMGEDLAGAGFPVVSR